MEELAEAVPRLGLGRIGPQQKGDLPAGLGCVTMEGQVRQKGLSAWGDDADSGPVAVCQTERSEKPQVGRDMGGWVADAHGLAGIECLCGPEGRAEAFSPAWPRLRKRGRRSSEPIDDETRRGAHVGPAQPAIGTRRYALQHQAPGPWLAGPLRIVPPEPFGPTARVFCRTAGIPLAIGPSVDRA